MSDDTRTIEQKLDAFVEGNIKPWLRARLQEERCAGTCAAYTSDAALDERMGYHNMPPVPAVPRVITADELEAGQRVSVRSSTGWTEGDVARSPQRSSVELNVQGWKMNHTIYFSKDTILILLADAPTTSYAAEGHEDAEVTQWHEERRGEVIGTRRGTPLDPADLRVGDVYDVHRPDGSVKYGWVIPEGGTAWAKADGWEFRLIHRPEVTAADTRAAERGDYTKRELPTEPGSVIQVTGIDGESFGPAMALLDVEGEWILSRGWADEWVIPSGESWRITEWRDVTVTVEAE